MKDVGSYQNNLISRYKVSISRIVVWGVGILALCILIYRIHKSLSNHQIQESLKIIDNKTQWFYFVLAFLLMPINWLIETWKWYKVSCQVESVSFKKALFSLLVGMAYGHLLPGRSSEFLGKILFFSEKNKSNISVLHFVNAAFQMYITLLVSLLFIVLNFLFLHNADTFQFYFILVFSLLFFIGFTLFIVYADKLHFLKKFLPALNYKLPIVLKFELLFWSIVRYIVFVLQFYWVFKIFSPYQAFNYTFVSSLSLYYLFTSLIPMISIIEVAVRSLVAIMVFQNINTSDVQLTIITTLIWLINLVIPSIIGFVIWLQMFKWKKQ